MIMNAPRECGIKTAFGRKIFIKGVKWAMKTMLADIAKATAK